MSVQSEITRLANAKTALATAIEGKGVTVPEGTKLDGMAALVESIEAGGVKFATGIFVPAEDTTSCKIQHGLGVVPDVVVYWAQDATTTEKTMIFGANAKRGVMDSSGSNGSAPCASAVQYTNSEVGAYFWGPNTTDSNQKEYLTGLASSNNYRPYCAPNSANEETFSIGMGTFYYARASMSYRWIAIAGVK